MAEDRNSEVINTSKAVLRPEQMESKGLVRRAILALAGPVIVEQILSMFVHVVDAAMVGRLGAEVVAGISLSFQPMMLVSGIFGGIAVGNTVLVARSVGAGDRTTASSTARQSLLIGTLLALILSVPGWFFAPKVISLMGAEGEALARGTAYFRWLIPGAPFMLASFIAAGSLRGAGDTVSPMVVNAASNLLNVGLNWVLIWGKLGMPRLEERGAAIATSISRFLAFLALVLVMSRPKSIVHLSWRDPKEVARIDWPLIQRIFRIGLPVAAERIVMSGAQLVYARSVASLGMIPYAAHAVSLNAESISFMPAFGFATAASTMVGQNLGAKQPRAASVSAWECWKMALTVMGAMGVLFALFPTGFMKIFTDDVRVFPFAYVTMRVMGYVQFPESVGFVLGGALRGAGDTRSVLLYTIIGAWGIRVGLTLLFIAVFKWGLLGAWLAMAADWTVRAALMFWRWHSGKWQHIAV